MIKYNPKIWFKHIISFNHSDTINKLWKELIALGIFTLGIAYIEIKYIGNTEKLSELMQVYSLIGFVLSLLLVFRTNTAYDRWWEGRKNGESWSTIQEIWPLRFLHLQTTPKSELILSA